MITVKSGLKQTFDVLAASRNEAATAVAIAAFQSDDLSVREYAIQALTARRNKSGHLAVLRRWHELTEPQQEMVLEGRVRIGSALRDAILSDEPKLFANACEIVRLTSDFDIVPTLVNIAEDANHPHSRQATILVHELVARLAVLSREPKSERSRRNPEAICSHLLDHLTRSVERFRHHKRAELIEAFVVLSGSSSERLTEILDDPHHACFNTVLHILATSSNPVIHELLLGLLRSETAPVTVLNTISKRTDQPFIECLLQYTRNPSTPAVTKNLKRIRSFAWLKSSEKKLTKFPASQQEDCVHLLLSTGLKREELLAALEELLLKGTPEGRLAACHALASVSGDQANKLILEALHDEEPSIQASAARQLRDRHIPGTMPMLLKLLDSPHVVVRRAARESLAEFSFENYLLGYESMSLDARRSSGLLVLKVDEQFYDKLSQEFVAPTSKRRLRAIEIAENLKMVPEVVDLVMDLLGDDDHLVRSAAASALQYCPIAQVRTTLEAMLDDRSGSVRSAVQNALENMNVPPSHFAPAELTLEKGDA